jgi:hypothetical protein
VKKFISVFCLLALLPALAYATTTSTTLSSAVDTQQEYVVVASATDISGVGRNNAYATILFVDREAMAVVSISGTRAVVKRGHNGTPVTSHYAAAKVWVAGPQDYKNSDPFGPCVSGNERTLPTVSFATGNVFDCTGSPEYWVPIAWGGASGSTVTGTGAYVLTTSPTLTSPSITTDIRATTAGAGTVGTAAKPLAGAYFGTAATSNFHLTFPVAGAARAITFPDPGGNASLAYTNPTTAQTLTNTKFGDSAAPTKMAAVSLSGATATKTTTLTFVHTDDRAITFPDATDTLVGKATTDVLTNKTLTGNINGDTVIATAQFDAVTGTTGETLTNVTGMVVTVVPGTYRFYLNVPGVTTANAGVKYAFKYAGGATITSIEATSRAFVAGGVAVTRQTSNADQALLTDSAGGGAGPAVISTVIEGTMVVGVGGTIQFQAAQKTAHADTVSVYVGASMTFTRIS